MFIIKLCSALSLVVIMAGCTKIPMRDAPEQPETPAVYQQPASTNKTYHVVRPGESLKGIAAQYKQNYKDLACWNNLRAPDYNINSGQRLLLDGPSCSHKTEPVPVPTVTTPTPVAEEGTHIVQEGEQLYAIAKHYGHSFRDLAVWNNIKAPFHVSIGQVLRLTPPPASETPAPKHLDPNYHIVLYGDTLLSLARHYRQKITDLAAWNNLEPPYNVSMGQRLRVTPPAGSTSSSIVTVSPSTSNNSSLNSASSEYTVKEGDSFESIATKYGIAVDELAEWNGIKGPPYPVYPSLKLKLEPPK